MHLYGDLKFTQVSRLIAMKNMTEISFTVTVTYNPFNPIWLQSNKDKETLGEAAEQSTRERERETVFAIATTLPERRPTPLLCSSTGRGRVDLQVLQVLARPSSLVSPQVPFYPKDHHNRKSMSCKCVQKYVVLESTMTKL